MKLLFLGTGAADWKNHQSADAGNRRMCSALLDGTLLIDPGPCVPEAIDAFSINPAGIRHMIVTHRHSDHFNADTAAALQKSGTELIDLKAGDDIQLGAYRIQAFAANHGTCLGAVHFFISDGKSRLFYGMDGAWLSYEEFQEFKRETVDFAVLDATVGYIEGDYRVFEHNNLYMVEQIKHSLTPYAKQFCISHMARTLHTNHETLAAAMDKKGILAAHDGMTVEF